MGQKTSRELPTASKEELHKLREESKEGSHQQPSPKLPESLRMHLPSNTNEGMKDSTPPEALKNPISQLQHESSTANKQQRRLPLANLSHRCDDTQNSRIRRCWKDENGNHCIMLYARTLRITWIEDEQFWSWSSIRENGIDVEVAKLLDVCWLEICGRLKISDVNPGVKYEVVFIVMMEPGYGWAVAVNLRLKLPQAVTLPHTEDLQKRPLGEWIELKAGEFTVDAKDASGDSEMEFSLFEYEGGLWKRGLVVKGAIIRPTKENI